MHLIVGSTGTLGGRIATLLLERGASVRALVRADSPARSQMLHTDPEHLAALGAELVEGDLTRPESLVTALEGARHVISTASATKRPGDQGLGQVDVEGTATLARLAAAAGVEQFVYVSAHGADANADLPIMHEKGLAEEAIVASGVPATILRPTSFMQDWIGFVLGAQVRSAAPGSSVRVQLFDRGEAPTSFVHEADVAELAVAVLGRDDAIGEALPLAAEAATYRALLRRIGAMMGTEIELESLPPGGRITTVPEPLAGFLEAMLAAKASWPGVNVTTPETAERFGLELTTIDAYLREAFGG